ncbi:MAG: DUF177 domain-containing protein [Lachnospiraceae bacterium]|nr:DUF177 domain-containing protein [Lachnospiraceae bacterium]
MLLNLTEILSYEDKVEEVLINYEPDTFTNSGRTFPFLHKEPMRLICQNTGKGKANLSGNFACTVSMECDRCLKPVDVEIAFSVNEDISAEEIEHPVDADGLFFMEGYHLDTDKLIGNELLINWPTKVLCRETCKGICKQCGKDLNLGECGCDTFIPDPRMAVINDIFNANKEV